MVLPDGGKAVKRLWIFQALEKAEPKGSKDWKNRAEKFQTLEKLRDRTGCNGAGFEWSFRGLTPPYALLACPLFFKDKNE